MAALSALRRRGTRWLGQVCVLLTVTIIALTLFASHDAASAQTSCDPPDGIPAFEIWRDSNGALKCTPGLTTLGRLCFNVDPSHDSYFGFSETTVYTGPGNQNGLGCGGPNFNGTQPQTSATGGGSCNSIAQCSGLVDNSSIVRVSHPSVASFGQLSFPHVPGLASTSVGTVTTTAGGPIVIAVTTTSLPGATLGANYSAPVLTASGGNSPYTFAATGFPNGLTLNTSTSVISGTPTQTGTFTVNVTATDSTTAGNGGPFVSAVKTLSLIVVAASQTINFTRPADVAFSTGLTVALSATASSGLPVSFASLSSNTCSVSGSVATMIGSGTCTIRASQSGNATTNPAPDVTQSFSVLGAPGLSLTASASPNRFWRPGQTITLTYTVTNSGNAAISSVAVSDIRVAPISCATTTLAAGATTTCSGSFITQAPDLLARGITTTATARAQFNSTAIASVAVSTTIGLDENEIRRATTSAIQGFLGQRANLLTTTGPDSGRFHTRLGGGSMFGGAETPASASLIAPPAMRGGVGLGSGSLPSGGIGGYSSALNPSMLGGMYGTAMSPIERQGSMPSAFGRREFDMAQAERRTSASPFMFSGFADDGMSRLAFATSLSQMRAAADAEVEHKRATVAVSGASGLGVSSEATSNESATASALGLTASAPSHRPTARQPTFDIWVEGVSSYFSQSRIDARRQGHAAVVYAGADAIVMPGLLLGVMAQMDWMSEQSSTIGHNGSGRGWMAGPYASARLTRNLFFDARVMWGQSTNHIDPLGAYTDTFMTDRLLASAKLTGDWTSGNFRLRPSAELIYFAETQRDYVNVIGVYIPDQTVSLGRLLVGPELSYKWLMSAGAVLEPFFGFKGIWDFAKTQETTAAGMPVGTDALRGRIEAGATYRAPSGLSVRAAGAYDGIGSDGYRALQGQAVVTMPLQ